MYFRDYDSVKFTNDVKSFAIISHVYNGAAEFTLHVRLVSDERVESYSDTYSDPRKNLVTLDYIAHGLQFPIAHNVSLCYT